MRRIRCDIAGAGVGAGFVRIGHLKTVPAFRGHAEKLGLGLPCDEAVLSAAEGSPMAGAVSADGLTIGNRWCVHLQFPRFSGRK